MENFSNIISDAQKKISFFTLHKNFITVIVNSWTAWNEDYKIFKTNYFTEFKSICQNDNVDKEIFNTWYADWQSKRLMIEQRFLPLVEFALNGNLLSDDDSLTAAEKVLETLQTYKDDVDRFYLNDRKNI